MHSKNLSKLVLFAIALLAIFAVVGSAGAAQPSVRYEVTIHNLATGQPISPFVAATHRGSVRLFAVGQPASAAIEAIAEDGNQSLAATALHGAKHVTDVVDVAVPLTPHGTAVASFTDHVTFEISGHPGDKLSLAAMLICTNDGFVGGSRLNLPNHGSVSYGLNAYDAGTEMNTELSGDIVDPCSALGPVALNGDPNGNENASVDTDGVITHHPGISGGGDLLAAHNWHNPAVEITITRLDN